MRNPISYTGFKRWADRQASPPTAEAARRHFGCSHNTACAWLEQWQGQQQVQHQASTVTMMDRVLGALSGEAEPQSVRQLAALLDLPIATVTHAIANLHEASRVRRLGASRPHTYTPICSAPDLRLMSERCDRSAPLVASLGPCVGPTHTMRIAA